MPSKKRKPSAGTPSPILSSQGPSTSLAKILSVVSPALLCLVFAAWGGYSTSTSTTTSTTSTATTSPTQRPCLKPQDYFASFGKWAPDADETVHVCIKGEEDLVVTGVSRDQPTVYVVKNLIKASEVDGIEGKTKHLLKPAVLLREDTKDGSSSDNEWRRSEMITLSAKNGIQAMNKRISQLLKIPMKHILNSTMQIQRYTSGDRYFPHFDSRRLKQLGVVEPNRPSGALSYPFSARVLTVVIYLSSSESGHTIFPFANSTIGKSRQEIYAASEKLSIGRGERPSEQNANFWGKYCDSKERRGKGVAVPPVKGSAVVFFNHEVVEEGGEMTLGELDPYTLHGGCVLAPGETKLMANYWVHVHPDAFADETVAPRLQDVAEESLSEVVLPEHLEES